MHAAPRRVDRVDREQLIQGIDGTCKGIAFNLQIGQVQQEPDPTALQRLAAHARPLIFAIFGQERTCVEVRRLAQQLLFFPAILALIGTINQMLEGIGIDPDMLMVGQHQYLALREQEGRGRGLIASRLEELAQTIDRAIQAARRHLGL